MIDNACKPLAEQLQKRVAQGLVDIKFFVRDGIGASSGDVCAEVQQLFEAVDTAKSRAFAFDDKPSMTAAS